MLHQSPVNSEPTLDLIEDQINEADLIQSESEESDSILDALDLMIAGQQGARKPLSLEDELDALIGEGMKAKAEKSEIQRLREKAKLPGLSKREAEEIRQKVLEWEAKNDWKVVSRGHYFLKQECKCGAVHMVRIGYCMQQVHKYSQGVTRFVKSNGKVELGEDAGEVLSINCCSVEVVDICPTCAHVFAEDDMIIVSKLEG